VIGRSGSAFAAEIGTKKVTEEVDALRTMAFDPVAFLVAPKFLAMLVMMPCLTIWADFMGVVGGSVFGVAGAGFTIGSLDLGCFHPPLSIYVRSGSYRTRNDAVSVKNRAPANDLSRVLKFGIGHGWFGVGTARPRTGRGIIAGEGKARTKPGHAP
jgi:hypothetical protein